MTQENNHTPHVDPVIAAAQPEKMRLSAVWTMAGARRLIARLRDIMARNALAQHKLQDIVSLIGHEMQAEVCSCYIMRAGEVLELFATIGLNQTAVHRTRLRVGEGLVGKIAATGQPLHIADAPSHPDFVFKPETGEEPYHSFCGVPLLRDGHVRGVLVIQNKTHRSYIDDEIEALQTVAMVVAELLSTAELVDPGEINAAADAMILPQRLNGKGLSAGIGIGSAWLHRPQLNISQMVAENPQAELTRLEIAIKAMIQDIDQIIEFSSHAGSGVHRDILETYKMFAQDRGWLNRIREAILQGLTAEAAVQRVQNDTRARLNQVSDQYLRERLLDFEDLTHRLLKHLSGQEHLEAANPFPDDAIVVARNLGPADLFEFDRSKLQGFILEEGTASSHVAIIAKALDVPVIGQCQDAISRLQQGDKLVMDCASGLVYVRPSEDVLETYRRAKSSHMARRGKYRVASSLPAISKDNKTIRLLMNAGLPIELPYLTETGADGIGLFRTEIPFMVQQRFPSFEEQCTLYDEVLNAAHGKPVTFRTLDIGGDKHIDQHSHTHGEENPALGWRAIRMGLDQPAMLRQQLRALLQAAGNRPFRIMFPLISHVHELEKAIKILEMEWQHFPHISQKPAIGVMIEVPSIIWQLDLLMPKLQFVSIGSNDLLQYMFAADRNNVQVNQRFDTLSPVFLNILNAVIKAGDRHGVEVGLCGEMASRPLDAMGLLGLGFRVLSMSPQSIGPVKAMLRSLNIGHFQEYLQRFLNSPLPSIRAHIRAYAKDHQIELED
ncbi:MAG: phosphoenolpyruvate--protein phosphotransferase [Alphaproteobacteria bacterium]